MAAPLRIRKRLWLDQAAVLARTWRAADGTGGLIAPLSGTERKVVSDIHDVATLRTAEALMAKDASHSQKGGGYGKWNVQAVDFRERRWLALRKIEHVMDDIEFLGEWPVARRGLLHAAASEACYSAYDDRKSVEAAHKTFTTWTRRVRVVKDVPVAPSWMTGPNIGGFQHFLQTGA